MHRRMGFGSNMVDWVRFLRKSLQQIRLHNFVHQVHKRTKFMLTISTVAKSCKTHQNMSFWSNKVDWADSLRENLQKVRSHSFVHSVYNRDKVRLYCFHWRICAKDIKTWVFGLISWIVNVRFRKSPECLFSQFCSSGAQPEPSLYVPFSHRWNHKKCIET